MKTLRILPLVVLAVLAPLFFGGCEPQGALFTEVPAEPIVVQVDSVQMPDGSLIAVTPEIRNIVREDRIILAGTSIAPAADAVGTVQVSGVAQTAVGALRLLPIPYADVVGVGPILHRLESLSFNPRPRGGGDLARSFTDSKA